MNGDGVTQDSTQAYKWCYLAVKTDINNIDAHFALSELQSQMTAEQVTAATRLAEEWINAHPSHVSEEVLAALQSKAKSGDWHAQMQLALAYAKVQNFEEAYFWASVVWEVNKIQPTAEENFSPWVQNLTSEQKTAVAKRVAEWLKGHPASPPKE